MGAKLIIDLGKCKIQEESGVQCSYVHHPQNKGFNALLEMIRFALICRRCEAAPCINACPQGALEKIPSEKGSLMDKMLLVSTGSLGALGKVPKDKVTAGILKRANMLCTGCGSCAIACPFGTIYTDLIPFPSSVCDVCRDRLEPGERPLCVETCGDGSIDYKEIRVEGELEEVFEDIVVKVPDGVLWEPFISDK